MTPVVVLLSKLNESIRYTKERGTSPMSNYKVIGVNGVDANGTPVTVSVMVMPEVDDEGNIVDEGSLVDALNQAKAEAQNLGLKLTAPVVSSTPASSASGIDNTEMYDIKVIDTLILRRARQLDKESGNYRSTLIANWYGRWTPSRQDPNSAYGSFSESTMYLDDEATFADFKQLLSELGVDYDAIVAEGLILNDNNNPVRQWRDGKAYPYPEEILLPKPVVWLPVKQTPEGYVPIATVTDSFKPELSVADNIRNGGYQWSRKINSDEDFAVWDTVVFHRRNRETGELNQTATYQPVWYNKHRTGFNKKAETSDE